MCGTDWCVYTPDGIENDNLEYINPGWGYWVMSYENSSLLVGGSLYNPENSNPPSRDIAKGWNMIGYYGTDGLDGYFGPYGNGGTAESELCSIGETLWANSYTALITYWEQWNPNQWLEMKKTDRMDPGAGYWLFSPTGGVYAPSTTC
jgi:hypothetical protein